MTARPDIAETPVVGASIPRSGHHHLSRLMSAYYGPRVKYCSVYDVADCCRQAPCTKAGRKPIVFQKSHDFAFRLPADIPDAVYLIQFRHPIGNAMSGAELRARRNDMRPPSEGLKARWRYWDFLAHRLAYYKRFHDKWIVTPPARSVLIAHETLEDYPATSMREIAAAIGGPVDEARVVRVAEELKDRGSKKTVYKPRVVEDSAFFDRPALAAYEAAVLDHCPAFGYAPTLGGADYKRHPLWWLAKLRHEFGRATPRKITHEFE